MAENPSSKHNYTVLKDGWVQNCYHKKGDTLSLTEAEAQYDVLAAKLERTAPVKPPKPPKPDAGK